MATGTERAPHLPHIPVPDIRGTGKWLGHHWKPVGLALATFAGGTYLALAHDRGPDTPPQEPARASDTIKPPSADAGPAVSIVVPPSPDLGPSTPPKPPKPPEVDKKDSMVIINTTIDGADHSKIPILGLTNIKPDYEGSKFKAISPANLKISHLAWGPTGELLKRVTLTNKDGSRIFFYINIKAFKSDFKDSTDYEVNPGDELFTIVASYTLSDYFSKQQVAIGAIGTPENPNPLSKLRETNPDGSLGELKFVV